MPILAQVVEAVRPWSDLYSGSTVVQSVVMFAHLGGVVLSGGGAVTTDRATLAAARSAPEARAHALQGLRSSHRAILLGLGVVVASGMLLLAADLEALVGAAVFWVKMGLLVALLANGALITRAERPHAAPAGAEGERRQWRRLARLSYASLALWFALVLSSTFLVTAA